MGTKVKVSIMPTAQYMGAVARSPNASAAQSGAAPKRKATLTGNRIRSSIMPMFQIRPSRWTLFM